MTGKTDKELKKIKDEILACQKCPLRQEREKNHYYPVIGEGNHQAKIMFIGEAPGLQEAKHARPFCGPAGHILDQLLQSAGLKRKDVYIANILKDRPPKNRDPQPTEIKACTPYLERQIMLIKPKCLCSLGRYAMNYLMDKFGLRDKIEPIGRIHGRVFQAPEKFGKLSLIPFYHPATAVYNSNMKPVLEKDFQILKKFFKN